MTSWKYKNTANQLVDIMIPPELSAQRLCTASDSFTLARSSLVIEYDGANTWYVQSQDYFVANSQWTNAVQKVIVGLV